MITMRYGVGSEEDEPCPLTEVARRDGAEQEPRADDGGTGPRTAGAAARGRGARLDERLARASCRCAARPRRRRRGGGSAGSGRPRARCRRPPGSGRTPARRRPCSRSCSGPVSSSRPTTTCSRLVGPGRGRVVDRVLRLGQRDHEPEGGAARRPAGRGSPPADSWRRAPRASSAVRLSTPASGSHRKRTNRPSPVRVHPAERMDAVVRACARSWPAAAPSTAAWIAGPASGCAANHAPSRSQSGWPVCGIGLAGPREVQEVLGRAGEEHRQRQRDHVGARAVVEVELDRHAAALGGVVGDPGIAAAVGEPHRRAYRFALHVRGARERAAASGVAVKRAGAQRSPRVRRAVAGVRTGQVVDRIDDLFGKSVGHAQTLSARGTPRDAPPRYCHARHRARRPARPPASRRAHRGPDALAAPRPARGRDPDGHHLGGCARRPARRGRAAGREPAVPAPRRGGRGAAPLRRRAQRPRAGRGAGRRRAHGRPRPGARACAPRSRTTACGG